MAKAAAVIVPTNEAKSAGITEVLPPEGDSMVANRMFIDGLRGPKAFLMVIGKELPAAQAGCHLDKAEALLLLKAVQRYAQKNDVNRGWHDLLKEKNVKEAEAFPDPSERQLLPSIISKTRAGCKSPPNPAEPAKGDSFQIVGYKPPFEAFTDIGFYTEFYKICWDVNGGEQWLDDFIENGDEWDSRCTWEPRSCLSDPESLEAVHARLKWCERMERLLDLRVADPVKNILVVPRAGPPPTPAPPVIIKKPGDVEAQFFEQAYGRIAEKIDHYFKAGENFSIEREGTHKIKDCSGHTWVVCRSDRVARFFGALPLSAWQGLAGDLPVEEFEIMDKAGRAAPNQDATLPPLKKRRTVVTTDCLGEGTFGRVMRGQVLENGDEVAVKTGTQILVAAHEASILSQLKHRHIIALHGAEQQGPEVKMILEYVPTSLDRVMDAEQLEPGVICRYASHIFKALAHCHSLNIVHCDMKPANLLVYPDSKVLKLADFGESDVVGKVFERHFFSLWWRPPEVVFGERARSCSMDIWAAGAVVGEMVGKIPLFHSAGTVELVARFIRLVDPESPDVFNWNRVIGSRSTYCPPALTCAEKCLRWDTAQRASAPALVEFLEPSARRTPTP